MSHSEDNVEFDKIKDLAAFRRLKKNVTIDLLWIWVLKLLKESPKYAYELKNEMSKKFGFSPATVTNYKVLYLLKNEGIVRKVEMRSGTERIDRKYYEITEIGDKLLVEAKEYFKQLFQKLFSDE